MEMMRDLPPDVPIWTVNASQIIDYGFPRIDRLFEMHRLTEIVADKPRFERLLEKQEYPIYMLDDNEHFPSVIKYPLEALSDEVFENIKVGTDQAQYFDSSFPYMLALAVHEGYNPVYVYGFEFRADTEFRYQRPGAALLIGWAAGKGVEIVLPENTGLLPPTLYGYTDYQSISRATLEWFLADTITKQNHWLGKFNQAETVLKERRKNGASEEKLKEAQDGFNTAYAQIYRYDGVAQFIDFMIQRCDRKQEEFAGFVNMYKRGEEVGRG
jgi:hypothetical protein